MSVDSKVSSGLGVRSATLPGACKSWGDAAVQIENATRTYDDGTQALTRVSFDVYHSEIFGLLGPNGAGKSTLIRMICGVSQPDAGLVRVMGMDPVGEARKLRHLIGAQLQEGPAQEKMRVEEVLKLFASFYRAPMDYRSILQRMGLQEKRRSYYGNLSGGERRRLEIARALVGDPKVIILDEPTTGLDAGIRSDMRELIGQLREQGRTVLLTTHYIEEAEALCDRVAILKGGGIYATAPPSKLIEKYGQNEYITVTLTEPVDCEELRGLDGVAEVIDKGGDARYVLAGSKAETVLQAVIGYLQNKAASIKEARVSQTGLEEAYFTLTGRRFEE